MESSKLSGNLPYLQDKIRRDPESYRADFEAQVVYFLEAKKIFELAPSEKYNEICDLINFLAHVAQCYPKDEEVSRFPNDLIELLRSHAPVMHPDIRMKIVEALILMRNRNLLSPVLLIEISFDLLHCQDKLLRKKLQEHIVTDIKNINAKSQNMPINRALQEFMARKLADSQAVAVKTALDVMVELYRKRIWKDKKTVNIIATACYSKSAKIMVTALKFFLGNDEGEDDIDSDSDDEKKPSVKKQMIANKVNKTTSKRKNKLVKIKKAANENKKKKNKKVTFDFSALHLINDPQTLAENIFKLFNKRNERFEVKLLMMNMVSRLIGIHDLYLANFFPTLQRFLFPHQREVTKIMMYAAQATHQQISPDELSPVLRTLANNFVTERYSNEVMAMGLNTIRELCNRNHHAMDEDLLQDLVGYRTHKDKGVYMAARSLMALFRQLNPELLARKTRGMPSELLKETDKKLFGESTAKGFIPGAEILAFQTRSQDFCGEDDEEDTSSGEEMEKEEGNQEQNETVDGEEDEVENEDEEDIENESGEDEDDEGEEENTADEVDENMVIDTTGEETESKASNVLNKKQAIKEVLKLSAEERATKAADIVSTRFLTDEDFAKIDSVQAAKQVERFRNKKGIKRKGEDVATNNDREIVPLSSIEMVYKKRRHDKASRMQAMLEGRQDRNKFGSNKGRSNPFASTTNKEKMKAKSFDMIKHKKRLGKMKTCFRDKQAKLKKSLLRQLKNN